MYFFLSKYVHFDKYLLCWARLYLIWSRGGGLFTPSSQGGISIQRGTSIRGGTFIYFWFIVQGVLLLRRVCLFGTIEYYIHPWFLLEVNTNDFYFCRFLSSNSGKIYLQKDIRMIIFRKSDLDTASDYTSSKGFELRSFTQGPNNPKFSPRRWVIWSNFI